MSRKIVFPAVYGLVFYDNKLLMTKVESGPEKGYYSLPFTKIFHGQDHRQTFTDEILAKYGIKKFTIEKLLSVVTYIYEYEINGESTSKHILGIVYKCISVEKPIVDIELNNLKDLKHPHKILINIGEYKKHKIAPFATNVIKNFLSYQNLKYDTSKSRTDLKYSIY